MPEIDLELFGIFGELFVFEMPKNQPPLSVTAESQTKSLGQPIFYTLLKCF